MQRNELEVKVSGFDAWLCFASNKTMAGDSSLCRCIMRSSLCAGFHTVAAAESTQNIAVPAAISWWLSSLIESEPAGDWCHDQENHNHTLSLSPGDGANIQLFSGALDAAQG